jgi:protein-ribulosamine 3-kinase
LEWIEEGKESTDSSMEELGFQFAKLHHFSGEIFGFPEDNYLGDSPQSNSPSKNGSINWPTFYVENRLQFQAALAVKNGYTTPELQNLLELLYNKIPELLSGTEDKPSLLHGDLWSGNYLIDKNGRPWMIDPAVYYGHREADLAMTSLFGGFSKTFYSAYESAFPLAPGYAEREPLYQLYHLLNHLNLFGTGYYRQVISILKRFAG